jgi:hypothetical protein
LANFKICGRLQSRVKSSDMYIEGRMPVEPMISIRKYLYSDSAKTSQAVAVDSESTQALYGFASDVLKCIDQHVLSGEQCAPLRSQLIQLRDGLRLDWTTEEASQAAEAVGRTLAQQKAATQQSAVSQAIEMQHIFAMLNQALIVLAGGNDRSIARLNRIQESVQQACQIEDMVALKFSLSDTVRFVKAEAAHTQESSTQELARFEQEVNKTREFLSSTRLELAGRPEGVIRIAESLESVAPGEGLYLVAFLLDRLQSFIQRYGPAVAEEVVFRLIKERLQPVAAGNPTFRWTASSLVAVFSRPRDLAALRSKVSDLNSTPLVHRIVVGNRTAVLTIKPSHLVAEGVPGSPNLLIEQVDRFTGLQP